MLEVICDTSSIQYLYQVNQLNILPVLAAKVVIPVAVYEEIEAGRILGVDLPTQENLSWLEVRLPTSVVNIPRVTDLGLGEIQVLTLALEIPGAVAILDDGLARDVAVLLGIKFTGTLGLLLDAKQMKLISAVKPILEQLDSLGFRLANDTRNAVLRLAGER